MSTEHKKDSDSFEKGSRGSIVFGVGVGVWIMLERKIKSEVEQQHEEDR